jgi:hypothetical protein
VGDSCRLLPVCLDGRLWYSLGGDAMTSRERQRCGGIARVRRGQTDFEVCVVVGWLLVLLALIIRLGWLGFPVWVGLTAAICAVINVLYRYYVQAVVKLDSAPCASCGKVGGYKVDRQGKRRTCRCECGATYSLSGPTLCVVQSGLGPRPYLRWKWWGEGKWYSIRGMAEDEIRGR